MPASALDRLRTLPGFRSTGRDKYEARCPGHGDRKASLSIGIGNDEQILLHCHAGCEVDHILQAAGIETKDLFPENGNGNGNGPRGVTKSRIIAAYDYVTADGQLSYQVIRYEPKDFRQRRPDGKGGWIPDTKGLKRIPYNLPENLNAEYIWIPEGEKDVESLRQIGLTATTNAGGANAPWTADLTQYFKPQQRVTILPDNDKPGRDHAEQVAQSLYGKVASLKVLDLEGLPEKGDVTDWLKGRDPHSAAEELCRLSEAAPEWKPQTDEKPKTVNRFEQESGERYRLTLPQGGISIEADRLRREHNELNCELCVRCTIPGARTYDGVLSVADFNLSSARARSERAKLLHSLSNTKPEEIDWMALLEEFSQRALAAEREGQPAIDLRDLQKPGPDDSIYVDGLSLPRRHPAFIFGDGGAAKSYVALYIAGRMAQRGINVALFDWELAGEDHRDRLERLFGDSMPKIYYARCERALVYEVDRLKRIVRDNSINYTLFDSVAFATDGPPEAAEAAGRYFRAVRQIGLGSLHIAHITKGEGGEEKPFGSVFWHNGARSTWFAKLADSSRDGRQLTLGLFNKKANLGRLQPPTGFDIAFTEIRTYFKQTNPADNPELAPKMPIKDRMLYLLKAGEMSCEEIADAIDAKADTVRRTAQKHKGLFTVLQGGKVALLQRVS